MTVPRRSPASFPGSAASRPLRLTDDDAPRPPARLLPPSATAGDRPASRTPLSKRRPPAVTVSTWISEADAHRLEAVARDKAITMSSLIRSIIKYRPPPA